MILFTRDISYEIQEGDDIHTVCFDKKTCTCKAWELSGIPCQHAICALEHVKQDMKDHISFNTIETCIELHTSTR